MSFPPEHDVTSMGNLARMFYGVTAIDLKRALSLMNEYKKPIGHCLVALGKITYSNVAELLVKQEEMRRNPSAKDVGRALDFAADEASAISWEK